MSRTSTRLRIICALAALPRRLRRHRTGVEASHRQTTFAELAQRHGRYFGSATDNPELTDSAYTAFLGSEFGMITPGNGMKWDATEPQQGVFDWTNGDAIVNLARENHQLVRGHTLVWHSQLPDWLTSGTWTADQLRAILKKHIPTEVRHYKGKVYSWDVVNEAFNEDGTTGETSGTTRSAPATSPTRCAGRTQPTRTPSCTSTTTTSRASARRATPSTTWSGR